MATTNELLTSVLTESSRVASAMADDPVAVLIHFPRFHVQVRTAGDPVIRDDQPAPTPDTNPLGHAVAELLTEGLSRLPAAGLASTKYLVDAGHGTIKVRVDLLFARVDAEYVNALDQMRVHLFSLAPQELAN